MQSRNIPITVAVAAAASVAMAWRVLSRAIPEGTRGNKNASADEEKGAKKADPSSKGRHPPNTNGSGGKMTPTPSDDELLQDDSRVEVEELGKYYGGYSALYHQQTAARQLLPFICKESAGRGILGFVRDADDDYRHGFDVQWVDLGLGVKVPFSSTQLRILHIDRQGGTGGGVVCVEGEETDAMATTTRAWAEGAPQPTVTIKLAVEKSAVDQQGKSAKKTPWGSAAREGAFPLPHISGYDPTKDYYSDSTINSNRIDKSQPQSFMAAPTVDLSVEVAGVEELADFIVSRRGAGNNVTSLVVAEAAREALIARITHQTSSGNSRDPSDAGDSFVDNVLEQQHMRITCKPTLSTVVKLPDGTSSTLDIPSLQCCYVVEKECLSVIGSGPSASAVSSAASSVVGGGSPMSQTSRAVISELRHVWYLFRASPDLGTVITIRMDSLAPEPPHPPSWFLNLARGTIFTNGVEVSSSTNDTSDKKKNPTDTYHNHHDPAPQVVLPSLVPISPNYTSGSSLFCCEPRHGFGFHVPLGFEVIPDPIFVEESDFAGIDTMLSYVSRRGGESPYQTPEVMAADTTTSRPPPLEGSPGITFATHPSPHSAPIHTGFRVEDWSEENLLSAFFAEGSLGEDGVGPTGPAIKKRGSTSKDESSSFLTLRSSFSTTLPTQKLKRPNADIAHHRIVIDAKYEHFSSKNEWSVVIPRVLKRVAEKFRLSDEGGIPFEFAGSSASGGQHRPLKGRGVSEPLMVMRPFVPDPSFLSPGGAPRSKLLEVPSAVNASLPSHDDAISSILQGDAKAISRAVERGCPGATLLASSDDGSPRPSRRVTPLAEGYFGAIDVLLKPPTASGLLPVKPPTSGDSVASGILDVGALSTDGCQMAVLCVYILPVGSEFVSVTFVARKTTSFRMKALLELSSYVMNSVSIRNFHGQTPSVRYLGIPPGCAPRKGWSVANPHCFKVGPGITVVESRVADPAVVLGIHPDGCQDALVPRILQRGWSSRISKRARKHADRLVNALFSLRLAPTSSPLPRSIITVRTFPCPPRLCKPAIDSPNDISLLQLKSFAQECVHLIYNLGVSYTEWHPTSPSSHGGPSPARGRQRSLDESPSIRSDRSQGRGSGAGGSESGAAPRSAGDSSPAGLVLDTLGGGVDGGGHVVVRDVRAYPARPRVLPLSLRHTHEPSMIVSFIIEHDHYLGLGDVTEYLEERSVASMATDLGFQRSSSPQASTADRRHHTAYNAEGSRLFLQGIEPTDATIACPANPFLWYLPPVATLDPTCCLEASFPRDASSVRHSSIASTQGDASPQPSRQSVASAGRSTYADEKGQSNAVRGGLDDNWIRRVSAVVCVENTAYVIQASTVNLSCVEQWAYLKEYVRQVAASWVA